MGSLFDGIEDAQISGGGIYLLDGNYLVQLVKVFTLVSRKKEDLVVVEFTILKSTNSLRAAGSRASWVVNLKQDAALGNLKGFAIAAGTTPGEEPPSIDAAAIEFIVSKDNPLEGSQVAVQCTTITTRAGTPFTKHEWSPAHMVLSA